MDYDSVNSMGRHSRMRETCACSSLRSYQDGSIDPNTEIGTYKRPVETIQCLSWLIRSLTAISPNHKSLGSSIPPGCGGVFWCTARRADKPFPIGQRRARNCTLAESIRGYARPVNMNYLLAHALFNLLPSHVSGQSLRN